MKKISYILIALLILVASGCSKKEVTKNSYTYKGENEFWTAEYTTHGTATFEQEDGKLDVETESTYRLTVTYKKDLSDLSSVKKMEISYETAHSGGSLSTEYSDDERITTKTFTLLGGGSSMPTLNDTIKVNINMDGNVQSLELISAK